MSIILLSGESLNLSGSYNPAVWKVAASSKLKYLSGFLWLSFQYITLSQPLCILNTPCIKFLLDKLKPLIE